VAPETVFFSYDTRIDKDVTIHPYVVFSEGVRVHSGASIGPFCSLESSEIHEATIGPFSRLRAGSSIDNGTKIGNFVEIKNSSIGAGTKICHLSYIGDCTVGHHTNIGAGTVVCNFDGVEKHHTAIGENVFVGSNSALIAPLEIDGSSTIAAGSVITDNVETGALAISRGRQVNLPNKAIQLTRIKK
jgi:bifunctional UDP-N-acetylglucosamine pyrophosphorylase/glucosamine-1-phosphate N-acetyltransferase